MDTSGESGGFTLLDMSTAVRTTQIARVAPIDTADFERVRHEVLAAPIDWIAEYGEYQSGGWWTTSLFNESGDPDDVMIRDCQPEATSLLKQLPQTRRLLDGLNLTMMWVRLARLSPNSFLWEHRDYGELNATQKRRLHIPLSTNGSAFLALGGVRAHLRAAHIWRLTPTFQHGFCNLYGPDRIHLIIDCYADESFQRLTANAELADTDIEALPVPSRPDLDEHVKVARQLFSLGYRQAAESYLLRLFFRYALPVGGAYDLIVDLYGSFDLREDAASWKLKKSVVLGGGGVAAERDY
jgi:hypothetical protein